MISYLFTFFFIFLEVMPQFTHHDYHAMTSFLQEYSSRYSSIIKLTTIGTTSQGKTIYSLIATAEASFQNSLQKPNVGLIGSLQGKDIVGKELLLKFIEYLCDAFEQKEERVTKLLQTTVIHILPAVDVDGNENVTKGDCEGKLLPKDDLSTSFYFNLTDGGKRSMSSEILEVRSKITFVQR